MKRLVFDIETNSLEPGKGNILCISVKPFLGPPKTFGPTDIESGIHEILSADMVIGHNIVGFDVPFIEGFLNRKGMEVLRDLWHRKKTNICWHDTLVMARLVFPDQKERDFAIRNFPMKLIGSHSLKAWGYRLGILKGEMLEQVQDFSNLQYSEELAEYNRQDCVVTETLWKHLEPMINSEACCLFIEMRFADIIRRQMDRGFRFDVEAAHELMATLSKRRNELVEILQRDVPPTIEQLKTKTKVHPFNPGSRDQIAKYLIDNGWEPKEFTPTGKPVVDESILSVMETPIAKLLCEYLTVDKRLGQLADGKEGWLKAEKNGRIHGYVNPNGAVTGRCTHSRPNIAQVPASAAVWGKECRSLFRATEGMEMLGCDASGLELRCLAHYLAAWDDGKYADIVCNGDVHTKNQEAAGLPTRNSAKSFIYAFLYGAGDAKIGEIVGGNAKDGKELKKKFLDSMPALKKLRDAVAKKFDRGYLIGIDDRKVWVRSKHSALNTLLQSAGAIAVKQATILMDNEIRGRNLNIYQVAHIHDEVQFEGALADLTLFGPVTKQSFRKAGIILGFKCPLDGEFRIGPNWSKTH
jgi:DNA polymerase-1